MRGSASSTPPSRADFSSSPPASNRGSPAPARLDDPSPPPGRQTAEHECQAVHDSAFSPARRNVSTASASAAGFSCRRNRRERREFFDRTAYVPPKNHRQIFLPTALEKIPFRAPGVFSSRRSAAARQNYFQSNGARNPAAARR